jgi:hypothetical protein
MSGSFVAGIIEGEAVAHRVEDGFGLLACKGGVPALEHGDEDDVPVFGAEVSTIPWRIPKWPDRAMSSEEVCWCGLGGLTVPQDYSSAGAKRIEHCLGVALGDTAGHGASSG